jgi:epoxyqueuosine reductase QueG
MSNSRPTGEITGEWIEERIREFCRGSDNTMGRGQEPSWAEPLVGFADGDDPLFARIRDHIGEFYWTPRQAWERAFPDSDPDGLTVVCWVLPQTAATVRDQGRQSRFPSERWVRSRRFGEDFNQELHRRLVERLESGGMPAVAPTQLPDWGNYRSERWSLCTSWSHRHAAYVAGLGTFGLCDGLITEAGKAMRCGSVVVGTRLPPTPRPYDDIHAYCLHYARGTCGACMDRCPVGALSPERHDKDACRQYVVGTTLAYGQEEYGVYAHACGLCQAGVPCESGIPAPLRPDPEDS